MAMWACDDGACRSAYHETLSARLFLRAACNSIVPQTVPQAPGTVHAALCRTALLDQPPGAARAWDASLLGARQERDASRFTRAVAG